MTLNRIIELLSIERQCVERNISGCDRNCAQCDLVQTDKDLIEMYSETINILSRIKNTGGTEL